MSRKISKGENMTDQSSATDPVRAIAQVTRIRGASDHYTIARASVGINPDEPAALQARRLREATLRDLRRTNLHHEETFYDGLATMVENETTYALNEARAGRETSSIHTIVDGVGIPGTRFKWMSEDGEGLAIVSIQLITRGEQERANSLLGSIIAA